MAHNKLLSFSLSLLITVLAGVQPCAQAENINSMTHYMINGQAIEPWTLAVRGLKRKAVDVAENGEASTDDQEVVTRRVNGSNAQRDAVHFSLKSPQGKRSAILISGKSIDLSSVVSQAAVELNMRLITPPKSKDDSAVVIGCASGPECKAELPVRGALRRLPKNRWIKFPLPLRCFEGEGMDFSQVNQIFALESSGDLELEIESVRLTALGDQSIKCK